MALAKNAQVSTIRGNVVADRVQTQGRLIGLPDQLSKSLFRLHRFGLCRNESLFQFVNLKGKDCNRTPHPVLKLVELAQATRQNQAIDARPDRPDGQKKIGDNLHMTLNSQ